jgi:hypothetical protein
MADEKPADGGTAAPDADAAYKSELAAMLAADKAAAEAKDDPHPPAEKKPEGDAAADDDDAEDAAEADAEAEEEGEGEGDEADEEGEEEATEDEDGKSKYSKALRKLQKDEASLQKFKTEVLAKEKAVVQREKEAEKTENEIGAFLRTLKANPVKALVDNGFLTEADFEFAARQFFLLSPDAAKDPKNRVEAERLRRERERDIEAKSAVARVEKLERERAEERAEAQRTAARNEYVAKLEATTDENKAKSPILAKALEKNAARTRRELLETAAELSQAKGEYADPKLVVLAWTKRRKELLAELGVTEAPAAKTETDKKAKSKKPAEQKGATDAAKNAGTAPPPKPAADPEAEYRRQLEAMLRGD